MRLGWRSRCGGGRGAPMVAAVPSMRGWMTAPSRSRSRSSRRSPGALHREPREVARLVDAENRPAACRPRPSGARRGAAADHPRLHERARHSSARRCALPQVSGLQDSEVLAVRRPPNGRRSPANRKKCGCIQAGPRGDGFRAMIAPPSRGPCVRRVHLPLPPEPRLVRPRRRSRRVRAERQAGTHRRTSARPDTGGKPPSDR